jgi:hypothetical protein
VWVGARKWCVCGRGGGLWCVWVCVSACTFACVVCACMRGCASVCVRACMLVHACVRSLTRFMAEPVLKDCRPTFGQLLQ